MIKAISEIFEALSGFLKRTGLTAALSVACGAPIPLKLISLRQVFNFGFLNV